MSTLSEVEKLRVSFREQICAHDVDLSDELEVYTEATHKAVNCKYCDTIHLTGESRWKKFLSQVHSSSLSPKEKNEFIHIALSQGSMRKHYRHAIETSSYWELVKPILKEQEGLFREFSDSLCASSYTPSSEVSERLQTKLLCEQHGHHAIATDQWANLLKEWDLRKRFSALAAAAPPLIRTHAAGTLSDNINAFVAPMDPKPLFDLNHEMQEVFYDAICTGSEDLNIDWENMSLNKLVAFPCRKCRQRHLVSTTTWEKTVAETIDELSLSPNEVQTLRRHLARLDAARLLQPYSSSHPAWKTADALIADLEALKPKHNLQDEANLEAKTTYANGINSIRLQADNLPDMPQLLRQLVRAHILGKVRELAVQGMKKKPKTVKTTETDFVVPVDDLTEEQLVHYYKCARKVSHATEADALLGLAEESVGSEGKTVYPCSRCGGYHYGTPSKREHDNAYYADFGRSYYLWYPAKANEYARTLLD